MRKAILAILSVLMVWGAVSCGGKTEKTTIIENGGPDGPVQPDLCENQVAWDKTIKPLVDKNCAGCHSAMAQYDGAVNFLQPVEKGGKNGIRRIFGASGSVMPPQNSGLFLNETDKQAFQTWVNEGFRKTCNGTGSGEGGYFTFDDIETIMLQFLEQQDKDGRVNTRFLIGTNHINNAATEVPIKAVAGAAGKGLNQISNDRELFSPIAIGGGVYALELGDLDLTKDDWEVVVNADPFKFESKTTKGETIKALTGARRPWIHLDNFLNVSHSDPVYSKLKRIPNNLNGFLNLVEVDHQENYDEFEAHLIGVQQSEISPEDKDRLIERLEGDEGFCWVTYDNSVNDLNNPATDVTLFPLTPQTGSQRVFFSSASEWICQQKNGFFVYALFNNQGVRQDFAPLDVVVNTKAAGKRLDPTVRNARECSRCHNEGIIAAKDAVRNSAGFSFLKAQSLETAFAPAGTGRKPICIGRSCEVTVDPNKCYDDYRREIKCPDPVVVTPVDQPGVCRDRWGNGITCENQRDPNKCYNEFGHVIKCGSDKPGGPGRNGVTVGALDARDRELVEIFFKTNDINETVFKNDNNKVSKKWGEIGVSLVEDDPINVVTDDLRIDADINKFCARVILPVEECKRRIEQSEILRAQLSPLLTDGGVINLTKLIELTPIIIDEMRLFVDRLDQ